MDHFRSTKHFVARAQSRGVPHTVISALLEYGEYRIAIGNVEEVRFSKASLPQIANDRGTRVARLCERFRRLYVIISPDGALITVAHRHGKAGC